MINLEDNLQASTESEFGRLMNKNLFLYFLDLEVKRARRYQNFISILLLQFMQCPDNGQENDLCTCHQVLTDLLRVEMRETDILGSLGENKLAVLLPYADHLAGDIAKSRFESTLKYYDFKSRGYKVLIQQISFPEKETITIGLIRKALGVDPNN